MLLQVYFNNCKQFWLDKSMLRAYLNLKRLPSPNDNLQIILLRATYWIWMKDRVKSGQSSSHRCADNCNEGDILVLNETRLNYRKSYLCIGPTSPSILHPEWLQIKQSYKNGLKIAIVAQQSQHTNHRHVSIPIIGMPKALSKQDWVKFGSHLNSRTKIVVAVVYA